MRKTFPAFYYEQYLLGELDDETARVLEQQPGFEDRIAELQADNQEILLTHTPETMAKRIQNDFEARSREPVASDAPVRTRRRSLLLAAPALAAIALAVVLVLQTGPQGGIGNQAANDAVRLKGSQARLLVYAEQDGSVSPLSPDAPAAAGERVQVAYNASGAVHGAVYSLDGNGNLTIHFPLRASDSTLLEQGGVQRLPRSFTLDDAPLFERFYLVTRDQPFDSRTLATTIEQQTARITADPDLKLQLDDRFVVNEFTLWKGTRP